MYNGIFVELGSGQGKKNLEKCNSSILITLQLTYFFWWKVAANM